MKHERKDEQQQQIQRPKGRRINGHDIRHERRVGLPGHSDLEPYTLEELYARIEESEEQISRGEYQTEEEVREEMRKEFPWLINKIYRNYLTKDLPQLVTKF